MDVPLLVLFVGVPGSGKTTFARQLADRTGAVLLNSDSIRMSMWGSLDEIAVDHAEPTRRNRSNRLTFGALDYAAEQVLCAGYSVIYDCNANHRYERDEKHAIARKWGAQSLVVRIRVPYGVSLHRIENRQIAHDSRRLIGDHARETLDRFVAEIEEPGHDEVEVTISGEDDFQTQYDHFVAAVSIFGQRGDIR